MPHLLRLQINLGTLLSGGSSLALSGLFSENGSLLGRPRPVPEPANTYTAREMSTFETSQGPQLRH